MQDQKIENTAVFEQWRAEELEYLQSLSSVPAEETLKMKYYSKLKEYLEVKYVFALMGPLTPHAVH